MSISALLKNSFKIQASENKLKIIQNHQAIPLEKKRIANEDKNMFYVIGERIPREQVNAYKKIKEIKMDINYAHDIFNHMS